MKRFLVVRRVPERDSEIPYANAPYAWEVEVNTTSEAKASRVLTDRGGERGIVMGSQAQVVGSLMASRENTLPKWGK
jgi:hypothetical protein